MHKRPSIPSLTLLLPISLVLLFTGCGQTPRESGPTPGGSGGTGGTGGIGGGGSGGMETGGAGGSGGAAPDACGNGAIDLPDEECDGEALGGSSCESLGFERGVLACDSSCKLDRSDCSTSERCGNGIDDDGDGVADCADPDCRGVAPCPRCGDGVVNVPGEACDGAAVPTCGRYGKGKGTVLCTEACELDFSSCTPLENCEAPGDEDGDGLEDCADPDCAGIFACPNCGDGILQRDEECEIGLRASCQRHGFDGGSFVCTDTCLADTTACRIFRCGDGFIDADERCDDGNAVGGDGCSPSCAIEGDVCDAPHLLVKDSTQELWQWNGDLTALHADYPTCAGAVQGPDAIAAFTAPAAGRYFAKVSAAFDVALSAWKGSCGVGAPAIGCIDRSRIKAPEQLEIELEAGETAYLLVASLASPPLPLTGPFHLEVGRAICGDGILQGLEQCEDGNGANGDGCNDRCRLEGDSCADAFDLNRLGSFSNWDETGSDPAGVLTTSPPWLWTTTTEQFAKDFNFGCSGSGPDAIARFVAPHTGDYQIVVYSNGSNLIIWTGTCDAPSEMLFACSESSVGGLPDGYLGTNDSVRLALSAGQTVHLLIESDTRNRDEPLGAFQLAIYPRLPCGDGKLTHGEQCDDGNILAGDGCDPSCMMEIQESEPNNSQATAYPMPIGIPVRGRVDVSLRSPDRNDFWVFQAIAGESYAIRTSNSGTFDGSCEGPRPDTSLRLFDASGVLLAENDNAAPAVPCSRIEWTAPASGPYFIEVQLASEIWPRLGPYRFWGASGNGAGAIYLLSVDLVP